jgi:hypothetical protein
MLTRASNATRVWPQAECFRRSIFVCTSQGPTAKRELKRGAPQRQVAVESVFNSPGGRPHEYVLRTVQEILYGTLHVRRTSGKPPPEPCHLGSGPLLVSPNRPAAEIMAPLALVSLGAEHFGDMKTGREFPRVSVSYSTGTAARSRIGNKNGNGHVRRAG